MQKFTNFVFILCSLISVNLTAFSQNTSTSQCKALFAIESDTGLMGYINHLGKVVIKPQFVSTLDFNDGVGVVWITNDETGYVDLQGKLTVFSGITIVGGEFSENLALAEKQGEYGYYIDKKGKTIFKLPEYHGMNYPYNFYSGLAAIEKDGLFYFVNKKGNIAIKQGFIGVPMRGFVDEMASVETDEGRAIIDVRGNFIIAPGKERISEPSEGFVGFKEGRFWKVVDKNRKTVFRIEAKVVDSFSEGLAPILRNNKWGYINKQGKIVIQPRFDNANSFSEDMAAIELKNKIGFINPNGKIIIPTQFDFLHSPFKCGIAKVQKSNLEGYINKRGKWIWKKRID